MRDTQLATKSAILAMVAFALVTTQAHAGLTLFSGADDGAGSLATAPNSVAAAPLASPDVIEAMRYQSGIHLVATTISRHSFTIASGSLVRCTR